MNQAGCERFLPTRNGRFAALEWRRNDAPYTLCLHGWLDNAASFIPLAQHLDSTDLVALDLAGHGHSDHRPGGSRYYFMDNLWDIEAALDALGWDQCNLIGHSMGGALACMFAAAAPERVHRLVLLDGLGPVSARPGEALPRLRKSRDSVRRATGKLREFPDVDAAVSARRAVSDCSEKAARLLCERSLEEYEDHYRWRTDPALNWHSPTLLSETQVLELLGAIEAPTLCLTARPLARWVDPEAAVKRLQAVPDCRNHWVDGHHHFHMDTPEEIAATILDFLLSEESEHVPSQA
jgi:pimeloyl-ACP methyl ester carboxylesterase